ncbi:MAG: ABC transporter ATP-binding protein [Lachnospiraceae bacterium]|nr:ABC transporter ATP-binding protein [Lachnospiraceae bacterium]
MQDFEYAIEVNNLTKKYDGFTLDNVSFKVPKGSIMGFIGQNGAGKSTTINAILNIVKRDEGEIKLFGLDNLKNETEVKENLAAVFDELPFNEDLNAKILSKVMSDIYKNWDEKVFFNYLDIFSLPSKKAFKKFSKGMKMKLQIAVALSHHAKLLIMDEATTGLDPVVRNEILDIFMEYLQDENNTIFMSTHITSDLEKIADMVTFIDKGRIILSGYKDEILDTYGIIKCGKAEFESIEKTDYIGMRHTDYGVEMLVSDRRKIKEKYSDMVVDKTTLDEIMVFLV